MGLTEYSDRIFENICIPTLNAFMRYPKKEYLEALTEFYSYFSVEKRYVPYIKRLSIRELLMRKGMTGNVWTRGSIFYTLPEWLATFVVNVNKR